MNTLKESLYEYSEDDINCEPINQHAADCLVRIADDFAMGFAEWCTKYRELNRNYKGEILYAKSKYDDVFLIEELLEIYKKEKGL